MFGRTTHLLILGITMIALVSPATLAMTPADCFTAKHNLASVWNAAGREFTPAVAHAIKEQLDACPDAQPTARASATCGEVACTQVMLRIPVGRECGFAGLATASHPDAPITAWYQVGGVNQPEPDGGPAVATYLPSTDETTYHVTGEKWGFDASSTGPATIYLYGVPIPAEGMAVAGCSAAGQPKLCWAQGQAQVVVEGIGGILVRSSFTNC